MAKDVGGAVGPRNRRELEKAVKLEVLQRIRDRIEVRVGRVELFHDLIAPPGFAIRAVNQDSPAYEVIDSTRQTDLGAVGKTGPKMKLQRLWYNAPTFVRATKQEQKE